MLKSKVIRTIIETCRDQEPRQDRDRPRPGTRSPAAGGGLAGAVPSSGPLRRKGAHPDPRLGQSLNVRRRARRRTGRG